VHLLTWLAAALLLATPAQDDGDALGPNEAKRRALATIDAGLRDSLNPYYGDRWIPMLRSQRARLAPSSPLQTVWDVETNLAEWNLRAGRTDEAIEGLERLDELVAKAGDFAFQNEVTLLKMLAVAHLRGAEQKNCVCEQSSVSCVFPLRDAAKHRDPAGAEGAVRVLERALERDPSELSCVWLLNVAHMALGTYPDGVPALFRIPPARIESEADIGHFEDVAPRLGISRRACAGGAVMDDFDGDGDLDVITSSMENSTPMAYYRNEGDGTFADVSAGSGLESQPGALNFVHGDVDGDGRLDLYVMRGAWLGPVGEIPHSLLVQQADGTFLDTTTTAGLDLAAPSQTAAFADVDNDGDLDLFVGCETTRTRSGWNYPSRLYRNDGRGVFENVAAGAGVENLLFCKGSAFGDYDADGRVDLYVSNLGGPNRLYHNQGDGTFVDVALELGVAEPVESFATWWFDANNDGWLDILVANYANRDRAAEVAAWYKNGTTGTDSTRVYLNLGGKGFRDATHELALDRPFFAMGANFGDFDNDGFPDLYFGTGDPEFASLWPNVALRNDGGRRFQDITTSSGLGHLQKGHGVAFGDVDQDGDQDLMVNLGGAYRDDAFFDALYLNPGHGRHWTTVRLTGVRSNRFGVGARLRVRARAGEREWDVFAWVGSGGSFGGNSLQAEIGLADAEHIVELEVRWPATNALERFADVPLDRTIAITEGQGTFTLVPCEPLALGGGDH